MSELDLYINNNRILEIAAAEGSAIPLETAVEKYRQSGRLRKYTDFSPILAGPAQGSYFFAANIYEA